MGHHTTAHLLSSGLYRRPRNYTGSADLARRCPESARGLDRCRSYRRWGIAPRPEDVVVPVT
eukprot:gene21196-25461_t